MESSSFMRVTEKLFRLAQKNCGKLGGHCFIDNGEGQCQTCGKKEKKKAQA